VSRVLKGGTCRAVQCGAKHPVWVYMHAYMLGKVYNQPWFAHLFYCERVRISSLCWGCSLPLRLSSWRSTDEHILHGCWTCACECAYLCCYVHGLRVYVFACTYCDAVCI
jgi:hypothetical protein